VPAIEFCLYHGLARQGTVLAPKHPIKKTFGQVVQGKLSNAISAPEIVAVYFIYHLSTLTVK
jgi:hypothetical protein